MTTYLTREEQARLARKASEGDHQAFQKLYESYVRVIGAYICSRVKDQELGKTLCKDTFSLAYENLRKYGFKTEYTFYTFLRLNVEIIIKQHFAREYRPRQVSNPFMSKEESDVYERIPSSSSSSYKVIQYLEMLNLICSCCAKPHQIIALGFNKLLEYGPTRIIEELCEEKLGKLAEVFLEEYYRFSYLNYEEIFPFATFRHYLSKLFEKLEKNIEEVYPEGEYTEGVREFSSTKVKDLPFQLFFMIERSDDDLLMLEVMADDSGLHIEKVLQMTKKKPADDISKWSKKVKDRARDALKQKTLCS